MMSDRPALPTDTTPAEAETEIEITPAVLAAVGLMRRPLKQDK